MSDRPPTSPSAPSRVSDPGRCAAAIEGIPAVGALVLVAVAAIGCGGQPPALTASISPTPVATAEVVSLAGLVVADGGPLRITDPAGALIGVEPPTDSIVAVTAAAGIVVALDGSGAVLRIDDAGATASISPVA